MNVLSIHQHLSPCVSLTRIFLFCDILILLFIGIHSLNSVYLLRIKAFSSLGILDKVQVFPRPLQSLLRSLVQ